MAHDDAFLYRRRLPVRPKTFDETNRSVRVVAAAESPVRRIDPELKIPVDMILLVDGVILPDSGQVPLLDSHDWTSVVAVLGSARNFQVIDNQLECDVFFSGTQAGTTIARKVREGHLTDFSVGYLWELPDSELIPKGTSRTVEGRAIQGPARVIKKWRLLELSAVFRGADPKAKARSDAGETLAKRAAGPAGPAPGQGRPSPAVDRIFWCVVALMAAIFLIGIISS